jgi:hypothetical protein
MKAAILLDLHLTSLKTQLKEHTQKHHESVMSCNREYHRMTIDYIKEQIKDHKEALIELREINQYV